eukprot:10139799-Karenia_brevis.AAC.1
MGLRFVQPNSEIKSLRHVVLFPMITMKCQPVLVSAWARMSYSGASILTMRATLQLQADLCRLDNG